MLRQRVTCSRAARIAFEVCRARSIDDLDEGVAGGQVREELVASSAAFVRSGDQAGDIDERHRHEACEPVATPRVRLADAPASLVVISGWFEASVGLAHSAQFRAGTDGG